MHKSFTTFLERRAQRHFPRVFYHLVQKPRYRRMFTAERKLARGVLLSHNPHPSILFFTHPKCASRYVNNMLVRLAKAEGLQPIDFDAYVTVDPPPPEFNPYKPEGSLAQAFQSTGYYYGAIGSFRPIPEMHKFRVVLNLRDPRDVLTSLYYSTAYSHAVISPKLLRRRQEAQNLNVDEFVLANTNEVLQIYTGYCEKLLNDQALFLKYEDMVGDFETWLSRLVKYVKLDQQQELINSLIADANFEVQRENKFSQRRQVTPGDHRRKLQSATIAELNNRFSAVLAAMDYQA
jgi:hypothetical protein